MTLEQIAEYPIVTYDHAFSGRNTIDNVFGEQGVSPDIDNRQFCLFHNFSEIRQHKME